MTLITMDAADAVTIANLINLTDAKGDALSLIHLDTALLETVAYGTDRCILGRVMVASNSPADAVTWRLTAAGAKFITANVKPVNKWHEPARVTFDVDPESRTVTIAHGSSTYTDTWPVLLNSQARLMELLAGVFERWEPRTESAPVSIATRFLTKLGKLTDGFTKAESYVLQLGASSGPLMAKSGRLEVLIQPRLKN